MNLSYILFTIQVIILKPYSSGVKSCQVLVCIGLDRSQDQLIIPSLIPMIRVYLNFTTYVRIV